MKIRTALVAVSSAALLSLTACGSAQDTRSADDDGNKGVSTSAVALSSDNFVSTIIQAQADAETSHIELTVDSAGQKVEAAGDIDVDEDPGDTEMAVKMTLPGIGEADLRLVDQVLYLNLGPLSENKFAKVDLNDPSNPLGKSFDGLVDRLDPSKTLKDLEGAIKSVQKGGSPQEIDGVKTQPYDVVVDTTKAKDLAGAEAAGSTGQIPEEPTFKFWVGEDNLPRKLTSQVGGADIEATFTKWGDDVEIEAPAASEITEKSPLSGLPSTTPTP